MTGNLLSSSLDPDTLVDTLVRFLHEFRELHTEHPSVFETKLKNSTILFLDEADMGNIAPLPWLLARMAGAEWTDRSYRKWIMPTENYRPSLHECGLRLLQKGDANFESFRSAYYEYCKEFDFEPSLGNDDHLGTNRQIWVHSSRGTNAFPEEITDQTGKEIWEGAKKQILVNRFERSAAARAECIAAHGTICAACNIDFEHQFGEIGRNFIHVHHKTPLCEVDESYTIDPINDLVPLCPNCHSMIHKMEDPSDVGSLIARLTHRFRSS